MFEDLIVDKRRNRSVELTRCPFCKSLDTYKMEASYDKDKKKWLRKVSCRRCKGAWYIADGNMNGNGSNEFSVDLFDDMGDNGC